MDHWDKALIQACDRGQVEEVRWLLTNPVNVDDQDEKGRTALMAAVQQNNAIMVELLLNKGFSPNVRDCNKLTPFLYAGANGLHHLLEILLQHGADTTSTNRFGGTALLPSSERGFMRTVEVCLDHGLYVNHVNDLGWSALQEAVILGDGGILYRDVISALIEAGADTKAKDNLGVSLQEHAGKRGQTKVAAMLRGEIAPVPALIKEAKFAARKGNYAAALTALEKTEISLPADEYSYYRGYFLTLLGQEEEAIASFAGRTAANSEFYFYIANCYRRLRQPAEALDAFEQGIAAGEQPFFFRYHKSNYLRELGRHEEAIQEMDKLLSIEPERYDYSFHKANSLRSLGKHLEAAQEMDSAIRHDPGNPLYQYHKGQSLLLAAKPEEALACLHNALEKAIKADYYAELGKCWLALNKKQGAINALEKALELENDHPDAKQCLIKARANTSETEEGKK